MHIATTQFSDRRHTLLKRIEQTHQGKSGVLVLFSALEQHGSSFVQESTFYYLTGLDEPASVLLVDQSQHATLWVPQYGANRARWVSTIIEADRNEISQWGIQDMRHLGQPCNGYILDAAFSEQEYSHLISALKSLVAQGKALFMVYPSHRATDQTRMIDRLFAGHTDLQDARIDISPLINSMRRSKTQDELEALYSAVDCTMAAQESAAVRIEEGLYEYQIQAAVEFIFKEGGGAPAFPTIVASGKNSTTLHYNRNDAVLKNGSLVVLDCGVRLDHYCADLTRTYPVSGRFTERQREVYDLVLEAQQYAAELAQPGMWLSNSQMPEKSLHHLVIKFFEAQGYGQYFSHALGHYVGLDAHDVGQDQGFLQEGDVITLEPGLYIPQEQLGIRIEDMYWITHEGAVCMSEELPRDPYEIEELMCGQLDDEGD